MASDYEAYASEVEDEPRTIGSDDEPPVWQVKTRALTSLRAQVEALRAILAEAHERALVPEEEAAVAELTQAFHELSEAVRTLFDE